MRYQYKTEMTCSQLICFDINDDVITNIYKFDDAAKAFADFDKNAGSMLKVMIEF